MYQLQDDIFLLEIFIKYSQKCIMEIFCHIQKETSQSLVKILIVIHPNWIPYLFPSGKKDWIFYSPSSRLEAIISQLFKSSVYFIPFRAILQHLRAKAEDPSLTRNREEEGEKTQSKQDSVQWQKE